MKEVQYLIKSAYDELDNVKILFQEYNEFLGVNLDFQDFAGELESLPGKYAMPDGRLEVIYYQGELAGCGAIRKIDAEKCELKRLYVRPEFRNKKLGLALMTHLKEQARNSSYRQMYFDTLERLEAAVGLYDRMGCERTLPYYDNPLENVIYYLVKL